MANIGFSELVVILMILVLVFGASRLPAIGESFGKTLRSIKRGMAENEDIEVSATSKPISSGSESAATSSNVSDAELVDEPKNKG